MKKIYLVIKYGEKKKAKGYILDISRTGVGIASSFKVRKNAFIEIIAERNVLPRVKGRVVSVIDRNSGDCRYRLGVKFVFADKITAQKIVRFVLGLEKRRKDRLIFG